MGINIELIKDYYLSSDTHNFIISKNNRALGFFSSIESALTSFLSMQTRASNCQSVKELLDFQKSLLVAINKSIHPLKIEVVEYTPNTLPANKMASSTHIMHSGGEL